MLRCFIVKQLSSKLLRRASCSLHSWHGSTRPDRPGCTAYKRGHSGTPLSSHIPPYKPFLAAIFLSMTDQTNPHRVTLATTLTYNARSDDLKLNSLWVLFASTSNFLLRNPATGFLSCNATLRLSHGMAYLVSSLAALNTQMLMKSWHSSGILDPYHLVSFGFWI